MRRYRRTKKLQLFASWIVSFLNLTHLPTDSDWQRLLSPQQIAPCVIPLTAIRIGSCCASACVLEDIAQTGKVSCRRNCACVYNTSRSNVHACPTESWLRFWTVDSMRFSAKPTKPPYICESRGNHPFDREAGGFFQVLNVPDGSSIKTCCYDCTIRI